MDNYGCAKKEIGGTAMDTDMLRMERMLSEWERWKALCKELLACGAVTAEDLHSPAEEDRTAGQRLLHAIRAWGESMRTLGDR